MTFTSKLCASLTMAAALYGCAATPSECGIKDVQRMTTGRVGQTVEWRGRTIEDDRAQAAVNELLARPLTVHSAVQIALLNNRSLQATLEELAISQADLVQAGLLHNPFFAASFRLPDRAPNGTDTELSVEQDFLDLLVLPLRKKVAAAEFERVQLTVADHVVQLANDVKIAVYTTQARQQLLAKQGEIEESARTAAELAQRQSDAGTLNDLGLANQQTLAAQARLELTRTEAEFDADRERLDRLMGLSPAQAVWTIETSLPELPAREAPAAQLEAAALRQRLDLRAARLEIASLARAVSLTRGFRYFASLDVGVDTERTPDGQRVTGPTLSLQIPIFDQGQARIGRAEALLRQAQDRYMALAVDAASQVREASVRLAASRSMVSATNAMLHQRRHVIDLTQQQYNGMLKGTYDLLYAKQSEADAERAYIETRRDYWIARIQLEQAIGGMLDSKSTTQPVGEAK
jgi:outer membrane protein, heavy metal efflux system